MIDFFRKIRSAWRSRLAGLTRLTPYPRDSYDEWKYLRREAELRELAQAVHELGIVATGGQWGVPARAVRKRSAKAKAPKP